MRHVGTDRVREKAIETGVAHTWLCTSSPAPLRVFSVCLCVCVFTVKQVLEHVAAIITTIRGQCRGPTTSCESVCVCVCVRPI